MCIRDRYFAILSLRSKISFSRSRFNIFICGEWKTHKLESGKRTSKHIFATATAVRLWSCSEWRYRVSIVWATSRPLWCLRTSDDFSSGTSRPRWPLSVLRHVCPFSTPGVDSFDLKWILRKQKRTFDLLSLLRVRIGKRVEAVSYTHLTLPTIYSV